ncbi:MAG: hypothetical protein KME55_29665 [Nostoc indistinguendum CM1-VF10]|nr:hypothetical protein [Nostoc indistinguendum CM1-VF10]
MPYPVDSTPSDKLPQEENRATATINITAVEVPELTEKWGNTFSVTVTPK